MSALAASLVSCSVLVADPLPPAASDAPASPGADSAWPTLLSAQYTYVRQHQTFLDSPYSGPLILHADGDTQPSQTIGFYGRWAPFSWGQLYLDTEKFMGAGVSGATGMGGLTNGDVVREGAAGLKKAFYIARAYVRPMIRLPGGRRAPGWSATLTSGK